MYKIILIVVLCLLGIFIHPFDPGLLDFIYRFIVFSSIVYLVYNIYRLPAEEAEETIATNQLVPTAVSDIFEIKSDWKLMELLNNDERTSQFLKDQFDLLASLVFPDNGWIFNRDQSKIKVIHQKTFMDQTVTDLKDQYAISGLIQILDDKNEIIIENNIDKTRNLLPFYEDIDYAPASFIGLPINIQNDEKLFIIFDSHNTEHFNREDITLFSKLVENTSIWILNRVKAYTLFRDLKDQTNLLNFAKDLNSIKTISASLERFSLLISDEFEATRLTISTLRKENNTGIIKMVIGQKDDFEENTEFPLDEGLTGWIMSKNKPYLIEDLEKGEYFIPRYNKNEKTNSGLRSFLGLPIEANDHIFGAVTLENRLPNKYSEKDKKRLKNIVDIFSTSFLRFTSSKISA